MRITRVLAFIMIVMLAGGCLEDVEFPAYNASKNYCGPEGKLSGPNKNLLSQANFNYACYTHDKCYAECAKTMRTQAYCDREFKGIMDDACDAELDRLMNECEKRGKWNPLRYACIAKVRAQISSCWTQSATYYGLVATTGKPIGSYTCDDSKFA
ncbi:MAG: hypothetical protein ABIH11_04190 [Candidatus Altiarchaeota archaeon]